ncbi:hypothetical protein N9M16_01810 [Candidatus Dependentiae bacterium]|nr:hypothetical protein [Candidatus Dependentiae bacterium]
MDVSPVRSPRALSPVREDLANQGDEALDRPAPTTGTKRPTQFKWGKRFDPDRLLRTEALLEAAYDTKAMLNKRGENEKNWRSVVTD